MHRRENALHVPATRLTNSLAELASSSISPEKKKAREARTSAGTINRSFDHAEKEIAAVAEIPNQAV